MRILTAPLLGATLVAATATAATAQSGPLVTAENLNGALDDVRVIDIRAEDAFANGHLDGAANAPYGLFRGPAENPGQLVPIEELQQVYRDLGLELDDRIVVSYAGESVTDFGAAARVYWTLKSSGFEDISVLNGGLAAWQEAGFDLTDAAPQIEASDIEVTWNDQWTASREDVQTAIDGEGLLLDARPESFWSGVDSHPAAAKPGTLPQSEYFEHASWFSDGPTIVDASAAQSLATDQGLSDADSIISFCNTGHWAATNWFAMSELAGLEDVKLYPESVVGWSNAGGEMMNVPGPLTMLWRQVTGLF